MSFDIYLSQNDKVVKVEQHFEGGTYAINGTEDAELNITYNYSPFYYEHLDSKQGIRWLYGKCGNDVIERLERAISILGNERNEDYWKPTAGNAGYALSILFQWAKQYPCAIFGGD